MNKGGRPTKYDYPKFEKLLNEYLWKCVDKRVKLLTYKKTGSDWNVLGTKHEYKLYANVPTLSWFAHYIWISRETIYAWSRRYEEFSDLIEFLQTHQIEKLVNWGINKMYNQSICCLRLVRLWIWRHRSF